MIRSHAQPPRSVLWTTLQETATIYCANAHAALEVGCAAETCVSEGAAILAQLELVTEADDASVELTDLTRTMMGASSSLHHVVESRARLLLEEAANLLPVADGNDETAEDAHTQFAALRAREPMIIDEKITRVGELHRFIGDLVDSRR